MLGMATRALGWESDRLISSSGLVDELATALAMARLELRADPDSRTIAELTLRRLLEQLAGEP